jgi:hypothetical protein
MRAGPARRECPGYRPVSIRLNGVARPYSQRAYLRDVGRPRSASTSPIAPTPPLWAGYNAGIRDWINGRGGLTVTSNGCGHPIPIAFFASARLGGAKRKHGLRSERPCRSRYGGHQDRLRVALTRSPHCLAMPLLCAFETCGQRRVLQAEIVASMPGEEASRKRLRLGARPIRSVPPLQKPGVRPRADRDDSLPPSVVRSPRNPS